MDNFIYDYYIKPIISHTGYNVVNTLTYAAIALVALYVIFQLFKKYNIKIDRSFFFSVIPFVLFGSTVRVITDAIDGGKFLPVTPVHQLVLQSHIYDYGYFTVSPGIYVVTAFLLFASMIILRLLKKPQLLGYVGLALWLPHFLLLLPFLGYALYAVPVIVLALIPFFLVRKWLKSDIYALMAGAQALDGAATFLILDYGKSFLGIQYFEQHVFSNGLCGIFNTCLLFYAVKLAVSSAAAYLLANDKEAGESEKLFIALVILIMGLAPGLRDVLRMAAGT